MKDFVIEIDNDESNAECLLWLFIQDSKELNSTAGITWHSIMVMWLSHYKIHYSVCWLINSAV